MPKSTRRRTGGVIRKDIFAPPEDYDDEEAGPAMLLTCYKIAQELRGMGVERVRFVTQSVQTAVLLQQVVYIHRRAQVTNGVASPTSQNVRISVLGCEDARSASRKRQGRLMHFGLAVDDDVVIVIAPSTQRKGSRDVLEDLENLAGAAGALHRPLVLVNPRLVRRSAVYGNRPPYLLKGFTTAFDADAFALQSRHSPKESCAVLRRWPYNWEVYYNGRRKKQDRGYVYLGALHERPSRSELEAQLELYTEMWARKS